MKGKGLADIQLTDWLAGALRLGIQGEVAYSLSTLTAIATLLGNHTEAKRLAQQCLAIQQAQGDRRGIATTLQRFGDLARLSGDYAEAKQRLLESCAVYQEIGDTWGLSWNLYSLGQVSYELKEYSETKRYGETALAFFQSTGNQNGIASTLCIIGKAAYGLEEYSEAKNIFVRALEIALSVQALPIAVWALSWIAMLLAKEGKPEQALELATFAAQHPASDQEIRSRAARLLAELEKQLPPEVIAVAKAKAQTEKLEEVVGKVLAGECATEHFFRDPSSSVRT